MDARYTALHLPCSAGNTDIVHSIFVICHQHHNLKDTSGMTPLHYACKSGIVGIVSLFMIASIDLNARDGQDSVASCMR